ncbi:methionine adenosyltransferase [Methanospirillum lacunae]|uniref:S-adenosylmethionine synthase n=1 Tax=Methanospirillum lacunae TaxID=668570 RepID=A0A2V2N2X8_9EURY|nr:methionine adenosyltransferase [Methanospirillum lacunae]PWR74119.1 methionine adenosyltransferase [Methanospirillum lacunae]
MKRNIAIDILNQTPLEQQQIELVERKCLGHPDSIADGIAESISQALCRNYIDQVGGVLHHNTDQGEVVAGESLPAFGGGKILKPIFILLDGRATKEFNGEKIPAEPIALKAAKDYLRTILPELDFDRDVTMDVRLGTGSTDLRDVFKPEEGTIPRANDTSFGVSFAPFSEIETCVREISSYIDNTLRPKYPAYGQDIKIMGLRQGDAIKLTLCCAMVDRYISSLSEYVDYRSRLQEEATRIAKQCTKRSVEVSINAADCDKECSLFLTVTGTSAEMGDDGSVGRGNRANGLITPHRPMSMEATSGKNPINHIGKIYNLLSSDLAHECVKKVDGLSEIQVRLLSQIGMPIDQPLIASVQIISESGVTLKDIEKDVYEIIDYGLENITSITERVIKGELKTF